MKTHLMKLVTIIAEALPRDPLEQLLREAGAQGSTLSAVEGRGAHGVRPAETGEYANIRVEGGVSAEVAARLLTRLESDFLEMKEAWRRYQPLRPPGAAPEIVPPAAELVRPRLAEDLRRQEDALAGAQIRALRAREEADPADATAANALGVLLARRGYLGQAAARFERAVALAPAFAGAHGNLGNVRYEQGRHREAGVLRGVPPARRDAGGPRRARPRLVRARAVRPRPRALPEGDGDGAGDRRGCGVRRAGGGPLKGAGRRRRAEGFMRFHVWQGELDNGKIYKITIGGAPEKIPD